MGGAGFGPGPGALVQGEGDGLEERLHHADGQGRPPIPGEYVGHGEATMRCMRL